MTFAALKERVLAIQNLFNAAEAARRLPDQRYATANNIAPDYYQNQSATDADRAAFNAVRKRYAAEERFHGEVARDRELKRIAVEIDRLRSDLPGIAASARFDLVDAAREFRS